jgi:hypothetical protein
VEQTLFEGNLSFLAIICKLAVCRGCQKTTKKQVSPFLAIISKPHSNGDDSAIRCTSLLATTIRKSVLIEALHTQKKKGIVVQGATMTRLFQTPLTNGENPELKKRK